MAPPKKNVDVAKAAQLVSQTSKNEKDPFPWDDQSVFDYVLEEIEESYRYYSGMSTETAGDYLYYQRERLSGFYPHNSASYFSRLGPTGYLSDEQQKQQQQQIKQQKKQIQQQVKQQKKVQQKKQAQQKQVRNYSSSSHPSIKYSFSGADCRAWGYFSSDIKQATIKPQTILIDSLGTISISIHESKSPVRRLGHMAPVGYTRAIRTIAGSMVLTIIGSEHPLKELSSVDPRSIVYYSQDANNSGNIVTKISPFNLILLYQSELPGSKGAKLELKGVEFINEGIVTSVNDLVSEVVLQFVALDIVSFDEEKDFFDKLWMV